MILTALIQKDVGDLSTTFVHNRVDKKKIYLKTSS
jgi:hypothetical protein